MFLDNKESNLDILDQESELIEELINLYRLWPEYVTEISPENISYLHKNKLLKIKKNSHEKIVATLYKKPLRKEIGIFDSDQIFRIGGLATDKSPESKAMVVELMEDLLEETLIKSQRLIAKTDNPVLARFLKKLGMQEISFEEARKKYPKTMQLYLENSNKTENEYSGSNFYLYNIQE